MIVPEGTDSVEQAVISCILLDPTLIDEAIRKGLDRSHFESISNGIVYGTMFSMSRAGIPIEMRVLGKKLEEKGRLNSVGGLGHLAYLESLFPDTSQFDTYVESLLDSWFRRTVTTSAAKIKHIPRSCDTTEKVMSHVTGIYREIQKASEGRIGGLTDLSQSALEVLESLEGDSRSISTGFGQLDDYLGGLVPGALYIVAGRPGMGKTALAISMLRNFASRDRTGGMFSLEMSHQELTMRILSQESGIPFSRIRNRELTQDEWRGLRASAKILADWQISFDDSSFLTIESLTAKAKNMQVKHGHLDVLVVDYLHLMTPSGYDGQRHLEISQFTRGLKCLAREMGVPVVALSQLSRKCEERHNKRPLLSDLRESGSIEQDADAVIFMYRDSVYNVKANRQTGGDERCEAIVAKHRNGPTGTARLIWQGETMQFRDDPHGNISAMPVQGPQTNRAGIG